MSVFKRVRSPFRSTPCQLFGIIITSSLFLFGTRELYFLDSSTSTVKRFYINAKTYIFQDTDQAKTEHTGERNLDPGTSASDASQCLRYIFYEKPIKTGSSAITEALTAYLDSISDPPVQCFGKFQCSRFAEEICAGARPPGHLVRHIKLNESMTACLRKKGYYHVTSIREPTERIISAWRYAHTKQANYFHVPHDATLAEYLELIPRCALYNYYDSLPLQCNREEAEERAKEISSRFDEIIELSADAISDVHRRIQPFLRDVNVAPGGRSKKVEMKVPEEAAEIENLLYTKLRKKRKRLAVRPRRVLCEM